MPLYPASSYRPKGDEVGAALDSSLLAWSYDANLVDGTLTTPTAGTVYVARIDVPRPISVTNLWFYVGTAGTGVTALASCFLGLYSASNVLLGQTATQATAWATVGEKSAAIVGGPITVSGPWVYAALLVGVQATTPLQHPRGNSRSDPTLTNFGYARPPYRVATQVAGGLTALPSPLGALTAFHSTPLFGLS